MKKARETSRELALLGISQLPTNPELLEAKKLQDVLLAAIRTLTTEVQESLEAAASEVQRGSDKLLASEIRAADIQSARAMVREALELTQTAINRLGSSMEFPELLQLANQQDVRTYALQILTKVSANRVQIDELLSEALVDWQIDRLPRIDRDIMRIAIAEILYLGLPEQVSVNEAVQLAKRYSGDEGHRFINGVLRRVVDKINAEVVSQ
ncbi:MAG: transcription antitermination protein NusB [Microcoleus sp. PH2017_29_MFU_D_A]|jgi:N utilization substance protein B|uniref:transcription antitermination factor NusB n=1 Tax=unclassified Microcoleus TaxID=2642155 RepID=UPI001D26CDB3|nr:MULTISPECIES: transcription antitermination factor NusB [unclassified Microcoleus]MCC3418671.1 transcription antitermination protein NusB [Microcoleus sp. PH2017_07_MST_O_A]MCC3431517.1 transcription antitermination protein NusB [Microcoleus sp. PH2017_04_SCI_O_A]MCC3440976.1 transcription antitermination protein NusB [Microcoleus sp. PH2017_03_ELD_O_A]MCC3467477.1 transcription antitermination protein NusB [Microcoleus sp. PH2017_06_SFM_O_A]MCC3502090.1 transcription antitermination protei